MVANVSVASCKLKVELDSHANTYVFGDDCLINHEHNRPVNVYSYDPKDGNRNAKTVDATVGLQDLQRGQKYILMINQAIQINGVENCFFYHMQCCTLMVLLCLMQCYLNCLHICNSVNRPLQCSSSTHNPSSDKQCYHYFHVYSLIIADYENEDITKIHLTVKEHLWDPSTVKYSENETCMLDH